MTAPSNAINTFRREIDVIDDEMHDLLMRRIKIVEQIGALKSRAPDAIYIRPEREAQILRRLVDRHSGPFPAAVIVRIWREMLAATTRLQGLFSVAVNVPEQSDGYWDLARDHYGSATPMTQHKRAKPVLDAVLDGSATIGVLPMPAEDDADPWWPKLIGVGDTLPRVIARLPFIAAGNGRHDELDALAIARTTPGESGNDVSLFAVDVTADVSRASIRKEFSSAELPARIITVWVQSPAADNHLHLIEIDDYIKPGDQRLTALIDALGSRLIRMIDLGGYAAPIAHNSKGA